MDGRRGANERGPFSPPSQVGAAAAAAAASRGQSSEEDSSAPRRLASQGTDRPGVVIPTLSGPAFTGNALSTSANLALVVPVEA